MAALGDGGFLMGASELETVVRLGLPMVVIVYDDAAYGAEVHHFGPHGAPLDTVRFPDTDLAAAARGFGFEGVVVRCLEDLAAVASWVDGPRAGGPGSGRLLGRRPSGGAPADRREGAAHGTVLVARGGVPRPLSGPARWVMQGLRALPTEDDL